MPSSNLSRRRFIRQAGVVGLATVFVKRAVAQTPKINLLDTRVISLDPPYYCGWPTLARRKTGELFVVWSGGREGHICPFGRVDMMISRDDGTTWHWPQTLIDGPSDDRDAGIVETAKGTLLVTTFTSLAYEPGLNKASAKEPGSPGAWPPERLKRWQLAHNRINADQRKKELGEWMIRSTDGGITWSARYPTIVNSPHGPAQLSDGRLLYAGKELWTQEKRIGVCESTDDGQTWKWLSEIPTRPGDSKVAYHELHAVEASDGQLIAHIRNENKTDFGQTLQSESTDGGKTWSEPHTIGVWGLPSFLTRLRDGRLLMSYGHRRAPLGNQSRFSQDHGKTWSEPFIVSGDGAKGDLGYPSTVELNDGSLLTIWYEQMRESTQAVLRQARWKIES
jgi:sialidase-1